MMASDVRLLPLPDSPTRPRTSPLSIENVTADTMSTGLVAGPMETVRSLTLSMSAFPAKHLAESRVETITKRVADEVQRKCRQHDHHSRKEQQPRRAGNERPRFGKHVAPARDVRTGAKPEKVQRCRAELSEGKDEAGLDQKRRDQVRQDVPGDQPARPGSHAARRLDVG